MANRLQVHAEDFQRDMAQSLESYFKAGDGVVPRSLNDLFGDKGSLTQIFQRYFDPRDGRLAQVIESQIGPASKFGRALDPKNKDGVIALIEDKVKQLVEAKLDAVLKQFSLDENGSAMCRLKAIITDWFTSLTEALGVKLAKAEEADRGHVKGFDFEADVYEVVADMGRQLSDETQLVRGTPGLLKRKTGDHLITLGETTGAPGVRIVGEAKDQKYKAKDAIAELQEAKKNRGAVSGIFIFAKGCEPVEFGNFKRIENDFYCTVDKEALAEDGPLPFLWAAYEIARAQAIAAVRKEANGKLDVERIQQQIDGLTSWVPRLGEIVTKASTIQKSSGAIESIAKEMKDDLEKRVKEILGLLRSDAE